MKYLTPFQRASTLFCTEAFPEHLLQNSKTDILINWIDSHKKISYSSAQSLSILDIIKSVTYYIQENEIPATAEEYLQFKQELRSLKLMRRTIAVTITIGCAILIIATLIIYGCCG